MDSDLERDGILVCKKDLFIRDGIKFIKNEINNIAIGISGTTNTKSIYIKSNYATKNDFIKNAYGIWFSLNDIEGDYYIWDFFETLIDSRKRKIKQIKYENNFSSR